MSYLSIKVKNQITVAMSLYFFLSFGIKMGPSCKNEQSTRTQIQALTQIFKMSCLLSNSSEQAWGLRKVKEMFQVYKAQFLTGK